MFLDYIVCVTALRRHYESMTRLLRVFCDLLTFIKVRGQEVMNPLLLRLCKSYQWHCMRSWFITCTVCDEFSLCAQCSLQFM